MTDILIASAVIFVAYWLLPGQYRKWSLILGTIGVLVLKSPISLGVLGISTLTSFWAFRLSSRMGWAVAFVLVQNIGYFLLFKSGIAAGYIIAPLDRLIPLGLSYYAFRQIHYALEYYKGKLPPHTFVDYCSYLFFLPTLLLGPIHRFPDFLRYQRRMRWDKELISEGFERILYGYAKVLIIGNFLLSKHLNEFAGEVLLYNEWLGTYIKVVEYTLSAYFIFAGFSDIAIGLSLLFGYRIMENFNYPFLAPNINEFWNRWHISLSSWVKDYVYFPIASISRKPIAGILATMLVIGLWHELSWRYILWGGIHGLGIAAWHLYKDNTFTNRWNGTKLYEGLCILLTFHFVAFTFIFIREKNLQESLEVLKILFLIS